MKTYFVLAVLFLCGFLSVINAQPAFPGAEGFGASATGGRGGKVIYVTNLNPDGPGSLQDALNDPDPRYILFKVSGVIPTTVEVPLNHGNFTLAGQTSPGGIIVRGFQSYAENSPSSGNFIVRHLRSRRGDLSKYPTPFWTGEDGITLGGVHNAIIDHCSFANATDEEVDISRSSSLTIQNCMLSETLGAHAYLGGMLINYSANNNRLDSLSIHHNIWNRIGGRMPEISCETQDCNGRHLKIEFSNNLFWDQQIETWYEGVTGNANGNFYLDMNAINNLSIARPSYGNAMFHFDLLNYPQNNLYFSGNKMNLYPQYADYQLFYCCNDFNLYNPNTDLGVANLKTSPFNYPVINYTSTTELINKLREVNGAFPRDSMDRRLFKPLFTGNILPVAIGDAGADDVYILDTPTTGATDSDEDGMPDYWETSQGLQNNIQDHNGTQLSVKITGVAGYTNLECYLNCLSDALINGNSAPACGINIITNTTDVYSLDNSLCIYPNPSKDLLTIRLLEAKLLQQIQVLDIVGNVIITQKSSSIEDVINISKLTNGIYFVKITDEHGKTAIKKFIKN